jgi:LytS/YehU family sensor histidine kinase
MKLFIKKHLIKIIGVIVGMTGGYLYYYFVGCNSGTCPITSNPYISIIYGGIMGYLVFDLFKKKEVKNHVE